MNMADMSSITSPFDEDDGIWDTPLLRDCFMSEAFDTELSDNPAAANLAPRFPINAPPQIKPELASNRSALKSNIDDIYIKQEIMDDTEVGSVNFNQQSSDPSISSHPCTLLLRHSKNQPQKLRLIVAEPGRRFDANSSVFDPVASNALPPSPPESVTSSPSNEELPTALVGSNCGNESRNFYATVKDEYFPHSMGSGSGLLMPGSECSPRNRKHKSRMYQLALDLSLITEQNLDGKGPLRLSEEEKKTLSQEGYSISTMLPLNQQEQKALKHCRRKILNKLSAHESRRKQREYIETLEQRVRNFSYENLTLRRRMQQLESSNRSLTLQLRKLKEPASAAAAAVVAHAGRGVSLMAFMLMFALFVPFHNYWLSGDGNPVELIGEFGSGAEGDLLGGIGAGDLGGGAGAGDTGGGVGGGDLGGGGAGDRYVKETYNSRVLLDHDEDYGIFGCPKFHFYEVLFEPNYLNYWMNDEFLENESKISSQISTDDDFLHLNDCLKLSKTLDLKLNCTELLLLTSLGGPATEHRTIVDSPPSVLSSVV